jgi:hypothetical protein
VNVDDASATAHTQRDHTVLTTTGVTSHAPSRDAVHGADVTLVVE